MYDKDALQGKTLAELREIGRQFGIKAQMRKQELADKILELSARQQPAVSQPSSDAELSFEPTGVKTVRPVGRPKKQTAPPAEEQTAVRIGRVVQGEPYRKQRGRRPKDNRNSEIRKFQQRRLKLKSPVRVRVKCEGTHRRA